MEFYFELLFLILILTAIGYVNYSNKKYIYFIISFTLLFVSMFRFKVGFDYKNYLDSINFIINNGINSNYIFYNRMEPAYKLFVLISYHLRNSYFVFFISSFITILLVSLSIYRYSKDYLLSIFIFYSFPFFYLDSFSIIRQWSAVSIIIFGYTSFIKNRNLFIFLITIILASLFHSSALISILIIPFFFINFNRKMLLFLIFFIFILKYYLFNIIIYYLPFNLNKIERLLNTKGGDKLIYIITFFSFLFFYFKSNLESINKNNSIGITIFIFGNCLLYLFTDLGQIAQRFSIYFISIFIFLIPDFVFIITKKYNINFKILSYFFFSVIYFYSLYISYSRFNFSPLIPYKFIFNA